MSAFVPHSHMPYGPDGSGFYFDNTCTQFVVVQESAQTVLESLKNIPVVPGEVFVIADLGTADGGNSMPLLYNCVKEIRKLHGNELPIHVMYEDQPTNDFKSLFLRVQGLIPGPPSYFKDYENVFVSACGTNFYAQCFPPNSVHLAFSSSALHWMSKRPCHVTGGLDHTQITNPKEKEMFSKQAAEDWETILLHREKEIKPGGRFVSVHSCIDDQGQFFGHSKNVKENINETLCTLWSEMVKDGTITQEEFDATDMLYYLRTEEELKAPFQSENSAVIKSGLSLLSIETKLIRCSYHKKWMDSGKADPEASAKAFIQSIKTWSNATFLSGLSDTRSSEEKDAIVDALFRKYEEIVARNPDDHGSDYVKSCIVVEKKIQTE